MNRTLSAIKIVSVGVLFLSVCFRESKPGLFISLSFCTAVLAVVAEIVDFKNKSTEKRKSDDNKEADARFVEGRNFFRDGIVAASPTLLEQAIVLLRSSVEAYETYSSSNFRRASAYCAIAMSYEKMAYIGSTRYALVSCSGSHPICQILEGGDAITLSPTGAADHIRCTIPLDYEYWGQARIYYNKYYSITFEMQHVVETGNIIDLLSGLRNAGYFMVCDAMLTGLGCLDKAIELFEMGEIRSKTTAAFERQRDFHSKVRLAKSMKNMSKTTRRLFEEAAFSKGKII